MVDPQHAAGCIQALVRGVAHKGASPRRLVCFVTRLPNVAVAVAAGLERAIDGLDAAGNPDWPVLSEMANAYRKEAHVLRWMMARIAVSRAMNEIDAKTAG